MEERPQGDVAHDAGEEGQGLTDADGPRPAELVLPDFTPARGRIPAFNRDGAEDDASSQGMDPVAEVVVIGEVVDQAFESAGGRQVRAAEHHHGAQGEALLDQGPRLQDLAPEVRIDRDGFTPQGGSDGVGEPIEAIHEANGWIGHGLGQLLQEIGWGDDVGITDDEVIVPGLGRQDGEFGDLGVGTGKIRAQNQSGIGVWMVFQQLADDSAGRIVRGADREKALHRAWVILSKPADEALAQVGISALDGLEEADGGVVAWTGDPLVQGKAAGGDELPRLDGTGECSQACGDPEEEHVDGGFEGGPSRRCGRDRKLGASDRAPTLAGDVFAAAGIGLAAAARSKKGGHHGDEDEETLHDVEDSEDGV